MVVRDVSVAKAFTFIDGSKIEADGKSLPNTEDVLSNTAALYLGNSHGQAKTPFPGQIDELRISNVARSADWVKATHDCVADADFAAYDVGNDWTKYARKFTVSFPGAPDGTLTDFPVLVKVEENSPQGFSYADCRKPEGRDLRFADAAGNLLACEVDTWDTNGVSAVWVKVPSLSASTKISAYYGWSFAPPVDPADVWEEGYVGVWHLGESALPLKESSGTSTAFTETADGKEALASTGVVGGAVDFAAGTVNSRLLALDDDDLDEFDDFTVELWTKQASAMPQGSYQPYLLTKVASGQYAYVFYQNMVTANGVFRVGNGSNDAGITSSAMTPTMDVWNHQVVVRHTTDNKAYCYMNGSPAPEGGKKLPDGYEVTIPNSSSPLYLGNAQTTANTKGFPGQIDELRISKVARSAEWVRATHDTVMSDRFATYSVTRANSGVTVIYMR